ncbi:MAG: hypothetical protein V4671_15875 [Armatimonadota bacterium]
MRHLVDVYRGLPAVRTSYLEDPTTNAMDAVSAIIPFTSSAPNKVRPAHGAVTVYNTAPVVATAE